MHSINFEMIHKGLKPSRSARQLQDTLSQEFLISSETSNQTQTLKFGLTANQSNKYAFRPGGDSDECNTHHSEEITQIDECALFPSHNLNIKPVAEMRINSQYSENKYQQDTFEGADDLSKLNFNQYQLSSSQGFDQLKRRSNSKPPLSRNNSTNNKDEITQFRGTDHCIAMNNSNSRKNSLATLGCGPNNFQTNDEESYVKQRVLINNKDLLQYNMIQQQQLNPNTPYLSNNIQMFQAQTIESNRITPSNPYPDNPLIELQQNIKLNNYNQQTYEFRQDQHNFSNQHQESNQNEWMKDYQSANIPIPLQRVSSPQGLMKYQDNQQHFSSYSEQNKQLIKQNEEYESLKPEDLLMSQQEYSRFQEVQKMINQQQQQQQSQQQLYQQNLPNRDLSINSGLKIQNSIQNNSNLQNQYQSVQSIQNNNQTPFASLNSDMQNSQLPGYQPANYNFNQTYSFSNSQFRQCTIPISQQPNQIQSLQESGFNPEQQLNSISSSSILNIQSPKANTVITIPQQIAPQNTQILIQNDESSLKSQNQKENQSTNIFPAQKQNQKNGTQKKKTNFLKRNQSLSYLSTSPINQKAENSQLSSHNNSNSNVDRQQNNVSLNQTPNSKPQNRCVTPQPQPKLERKLSENLLMDKSKKKIESFEDQQLKECTFKPQINKSSQKMQRSFSQFIETQVNYNKYKSDKQKILQEQAHNALNVQVKDKPDINKNSQRIIEQKRNNDYQSLFGPVQISDQQAVHNRLYSIHKRNESNNSQIRKRIEEEANKENTFKPQIHQRSKSIKRDEKIQDLLYKDAVRRNNIQQNITNQKPRSNSKYTSDKSERILLKKFIKEMDYIFQSLSVNQNKNISQNGSLQNSPINSVVNLDMASLFEVMIKSGFIKYNSNSSNPEMIVMENEKKLIFLIWTLLGGKQYNYISKPNLLLFLIIILNLDRSFDSSERSLLLKELSFSMSHSQLQNTSPLSSQASIKNFKNFEAFTNILSSNLNQNPNSAQVSPLNKSNSSGFSAASQQFNLHQQLNQSLMKCYQENYINLSLGNFDEKQQWIVTEEDKQVIRQAFEIFYRNRLSYEELKSQKTPIDQCCTFHPHILQSSKSMANQYREKLLIQTASLLENKEISYQVPKDGKIQHSDFLILQKRAQEIQNKNKQEVIKEKELIECTFKPAIYSKNKTEKENDRINIAEIGLKKTEELYLQSKNKEVKLVKNNNDLEYEKQKNECTFQPEIIDVRSKKIYDGGIFAKNINKTIERMRNARKEKEMISAMKQRGYNSVHQLVRHQKSVSSTSTNQMEQVSENYQSNNTRKDETLKNSGNTSQNFNNTNSGIERVTSTNSCIANNDNLMVYYNSNQSVNYKSSPSQNFQHENSQTAQQQQLQSLLNHNMFANQALQQFQQKNNPVSALQHSFAQQTGILQYSQQNLANNINENDNLILNQLMNNNILDQQNQENQEQMNANNYNNPLLEMSAPKFGRLQETLIQNSWQQNNLQNEQEQYINNVEDCKPFSSEQGQESVNSVPDSKDRPPLLFVDVNLGNQRSERIIVNEGDNPKQLAYDFARLHGLDDSTAEKLYQLLENQIAGLLSRIEEEENISHLENLD